MEREPLKVQYLIEYCSTYLLSVYAVSVSVLRMYMREVHVFGVGVSQGMATTLHVGLRCTVLSLGYTLRKAIEDFD